MDLKRYFRLTQDEYIVFIKFYESLDMQNYP